MVFVLGVCACSKAGESGKSLHAKGLEIMSMMDEIIRNEEYVDAYTGSDDLKEVVREIRGGSYVNPNRVYALTVTEEGLGSIAELLSIKDVSEPLHKYLRQRMLGALVMQVNGMSGAANLAAASVCTISKTFVNEDMKEDVVYLYTFDDGKPIAVTYLID